MKTPAFNEVLDLWNVDGSLRDVYVLDTQAEDWNSFLRLARRYPCTYTFDGERRPIPNAESIFLDRSGVHLLRIHLGKATANCHFFASDQIECDLNPREIVSEAVHSEVLDFIGQLARTVGKPARITPENAPHVPIISCDPADGWYVHPFQAGAMHG